MTDEPPKRRGFTVWEHNPSTHLVRLKSKDRPVKIENGKNILLIDCETSEILGEGTAGFFKQEMVDDEQFMKVYRGQIGNMFNLTKTGQQIFQVVWDQIQAKKDTDRVSLRPVVARLQGKQISDRVFQKGVRELLEKEFIYMSPIDGEYYINVSMFFNGNRIVVATEYIKNNAKVIGQK